MSNSALAKKYIPSPEENHWGKRKEKVGKIIVHHAAGVISAENLAKHFADPNRKASATYCIGYDGTVVRCLDEGITPGTSGGYEFDRDAVTVEVSNSASGGQWPVSNAALSSLIKLCADIAKRPVGPKSNRRMTYAGPLSQICIMIRICRSKAYRRSRGMLLRRRQRLISASVKMRTRCHTWKRFANWASLSPQKHKKLPKTHQKSSRLSVQKPGKEYLTHKKNK